MFKVELSDEALFQLKKLDNSTAKRIVSALNKAASNPHHFFERLVGRDEYKLKVGDYRIISRIMQNDETIFVISMGHRKNIYKKR
jgi:mRNA interferase RelE/StbE